MSEKKYAPSKVVRERYGVSDMSLWRWVRDKKMGFPQPIIINRRKFWDFDDLDAFDERQRGAAA